MIRQVVTRRFEPSLARLRPGSQRLKLNLTASFHHHRPIDSNIESSANEAGVSDKVQHDLTVGTGQVIFLNSRESGGILLGSLLIGDPYLAVLAGVGTLASSTTASLMGIDEETRKNGLWSYNGCLVGCATAVFVAPDSALMGLLTTSLGAAGSTALAASLSASLKMPQWTWSFNFVTLSLLLRSQPLAVATNDTPVEGPSLLMAPLNGLSQIFVVESALSGLGVVAAIYTYSPLLAGHALLGSTVGAITGICLASDAASVASGLWSYNSALVSMGVGVFFTNTRSTWTLSAGGAVTSAVLFGGMSTVFAQHLGTPCLTLPFCATMSACYQLHRVVPSLQLADNAHSPEKNVYRLP